MFAHGLVLLGLGVEGVAQAVAGQIERKHARDDGRRREEDHPPGFAHHVLARLQDVSPAGVGCKRLVRVTENDAEKISEYAKTGDESIISSLLVSDEDKEFLNKQTRIALRRCGIINPDEIDDFVNADGYTAIKKVLTSMTPEDVIEVIKTSGLAGRGGAGFPTWFKWNAARQSEGEEKYLNEE